MSEVKYRCSICFYPFRADEKGFCRQCQTESTIKFSTKKLADKMTFTFGGLDEEACYDALISILNRRGPLKSPTRKALTLVGRLRYKMLCRKLNRKMRH